MSEAASLLQAVTEVARHAGRPALAEFRAGAGVSWKADGSPVTSGDRNAERAAREWIARHFPEDGICGEELGELNAGAERRWIIDPVDGTHSFIRGVPLWGTLIGVARGEEVLAGAAFFPALDEMLCAAAGEGCWWNDSRASVSSVASIADATVLTTSERFSHAPERRIGWRALASHAKLTRTWGDCYGYLLVATGRAEVMVDGALKPWDAAALLPAIVEAGGVFTDYDGRCTAFGGNAIASNAAVAVDARALLRRMKEEAP